MTTFVDAPPAVQEPADAGAAPQRRKTPRRPRLSIGGGGGGSNRPPRPTGGDRPRRPPRPPRRPPAPTPPPQPLGTTATIVRGCLLMLTALLLAFVLNITVFSHVQHLVAQQQLRDEFRSQLAAGTAPVSEGNFDDVLLSDGAPVALLSIPMIGLDEVIAEGTSSGVLTDGPGHRRDTVLPGQEGVSVLMGRATAFGGPFGRIEELAPGDRFTVRTGQGEQEFGVIGVRYAGDPMPPSPQPGESRLILQTARGPAYLPTGVAYVDAQVVGEVQPAGIRQSRFATLPAADRAMATDTSTVWALVFALQFLVAVEIAAIWSYRRVGAQKTWVVFLPLTTIAVLVTARQVVLLLPNLL